MSITAMQEPYKICVGEKGALSSHAWISGTRLGLCDSTRSITTLSGQGRSTVSKESSAIAENAGRHFFQCARRNGRKERRGFHSVNCGFYSIGITHFSALQKRELIHERSRRLSYSPLLTCYLVAPT